MDPKELRTPEELAAWAEKHGLRPDWHEPDEQGVTVMIYGGVFDNAMGVQPWPDALGGYDREYTVALLKDGICVAVVNLATLFAWATKAGQG